VSKLRLLPAYPAMTAKPSGLPDHLVRHVQRGLDAQQRADCATHPLPSNPDEQGFVLQVFGNQRLGTQRPKATD